MNLDDVERRGIPQQVIELWKSRQGELLLPVQRAAVEKGLLASSGLHNNGPQARNMIIAAPTSSGKSFCAEMAAIGSLSGRSKAVWLFPLKSLAEQTFQLITETYSELGVSCIICTADHPENDRRFLRGDYQIAITIYEKFDRLLTRAIDSLRSIGLVVVDELQMLSDPSRGPVVERLLTKIMASGYEPQIIALSAVLDDCSGDRLSAWLKAELVRESQRPVDLWRGVAVDGTLRLRSFNNSEECSEPYAESEPGGGSVDALIKQIATDEGQSLLFLKSRQDTMEAAFRLAGGVGWSPAEETIARLKREEACSLRRALIQCLKHGVAFHNSDLTPAMRSAVEQGFVSSEIRVLCSTTTLALGVNLPADTVYLETVRYAAGRVTSRAQLVPITRAEFDNMTGRAGRLGVGARQAGRAIVVADSEFDRDILWKTYIAPGEPASVRPAEGSTVTEDWLLDMICCGLIDSRDAINRLDQYRLEHETISQVESNLMQPLLECHFVAAESDGSLAITRLGRAVAEAGMSCNEARRCIEKIGDGCPTSERGWIALALGVGSWDTPPSLLNSSEYAQNVPLEMYYRKYGPPDTEMAPLLGSLDRTDRPSFRAVAALKGMMLLDDWRGMASVSDLESHYRMHFGQILNFGAAVSHLILSFAGLLAVLKPDSDCCAQLRQLAFSVRHGLPYRAGFMTRAAKGRLLRSDCIALYEADIRSPRDLVELSDRAIERLNVGLPTVCKIKKIIAELKEEVDMSMLPVSGRAVVIPEPELVEIEGSIDRERFLVRINGMPVPLTGKSFKYFAKLAWSRLNDRNGWLYKEDIELGFNQARYLYRMKNEISAAFDSGWSIVENNRLGYYRLQVDPDKIRINQESLCNHPDWEVRSLFQPIENNQALS